MTACADLDRRGEGIVVDRLDRDVLAETVDQRSDHVAASLKGHARELAAVHAEETARVFRGVELLELLLALAGLVGDGQTQDLVHAVVLDLSVVCIVGDEIVVFIVPQQAPGADAIPLPAVAQLLLPADVPLEVLEADLPVGVDGLVQHVHVVEDALVHGLDAPSDQHLPLEALGLVDAGEGFEFFDELAGLLLRDETGALYGVHQQFQLRQLKTARGEMIKHIPPRLFTEDFEAEFLQFAEVLVQRLALGVHAIGFEPVDDLLQGQGMGIVRLLGEDFDKIEHFELLVISRSHGASLAFWGQYSKRSGRPQELRESFGTAFVETITLNYYLKGV